MKNKLFNVIAIIVCIAMLFSSVSVSAEDEMYVPTGRRSSSTYYTDEYVILFASGGDRSFNYIISSSLNYSLTSDSAGRLSPFVSFSTTETMSKIGCTRIAIEEWTTSGWTEFWSVTSVYNINSDSFLYSTFVTGATSGHYYRLVAGLYAKKTVFSFDLVPIASDYITCK